MNAKEYQFATFVDYGRIPAFLAYLGSFYQNANTNASCQINVLAKRWPKSIIEQISFHEKVNLVLLENTDLTRNEDAKQNSLVSYLRWLAAIQKDQNQPIISHYSQGLFLKPFDNILENIQFDILIAKPLGSPTENSQLELLSNCMTNFTAILNNSLGVKALIAMLVARYDSDGKSENSDLDLRLDVGTINGHGGLYKEAQRATNLAFVWSDPQTASVNRQIGQCARRWFGSEAEEPLLSPGNYVDPLLLEAWLIDSISSSKHRLA